MRNCNREAARRTALLAAALGLCLASAAASGGTAAAAPPGRAYEMVSPLDKNGGDIDRDLLENLTAQSGAAPSGDAVAFTSRVQFGDIESGTLFPNYLARRAASGWVTEGISPPIGDVLPSGIETPPVAGLSFDLSTAFVKAAFSLTPEADALNGSWGLYVRDSSQSERYRLLSVPALGLTPPSDGGDVTRAANRFEYAADVPGHVVFNSSRQLVPGAPPDQNAPPTKPTSVYEWANGAVRVVSVPPAGATLGAGDVAVAGGGNAVSTGALPGDHPISDDGRRVFFTATLVRADATNVGSQLMVREDGAGTRVVSASERTGDDPLVQNVNARFWAADGSDGSVAFFTSTAPLTDGAAPASTSLYRWDAEAPAGDSLTEITQDPIGEPGVQGPAAVSDDDSTVYFVATGVLAPAATRGDSNLYMWRQGEGVRFIAALDASRDGMMWQLLWRQGGRAARVSADGDRLLFASYAQLDPSYDTTESTPEACGDPTTPGDRCRQIYLYNAGLDTLTCLTCVAGVPLSGDANLFGNPEAAHGDTIEAPLRLPRNLSADGRRGFFETARRLDTQDNNAVLDVYEWEDADLDGQGELHLISAGRGATDAQFLDASVLGENVFFTTRDRLVGIDTDDQIDLYDARAGGGIAAQNPSPPAPPCVGDECQGVPSGPALLPGVGSDFDGPGDLAPGPRASFSIARLSRKQQARLARGRKVEVRVRVNRAGKVSLVARARLGRRTRTVARTSKTARKAGTISLSLELSASARRSMARRGKLKVVLAVTFAGADGAKHLTLSLRRARSGERRSR